MKQRFEVQKQVGTEGMFNWPCYIKICDIWLKVGKRKHGYAPRNKVVTDAIAKQHGGDKLVALMDFQYHAQDRRRIRKNKMKLTNSKFIFIENNYNSIGD